MTAHDLDVRLALGLSVALTAIGGCGGGDDVPDTGMPGDASADSAPMDGSMAVCGDGTPTGGELCDGDTVDCTSLSVGYAAGSASCRSSCAGYDVSGCTPEAERQWEMVKPAERDARWQNARCNDGTPYDFLYRPGAPGSKLWVIFLMGGGFGDDSAFMASERPAILTSTLPIPDGARGPLPDREVGIHGGPTINPDFHTAHMVFALYCSSDFYTGRGTERRPTAGTPDGYYYAGRHNIRATFEILIERYGLDDSDPELEVVYGGESAGCVGATQTVNIPAELLPVTTAAQRLRVVADGAYLVTYPEDRSEFFWGAATVPDAQLFTAAAEFWDAEPLPACTESEPGACYLGRGWYPAITEGMGIPVAVAMSTMDHVVLGLRGICTENCATDPQGCFPGCSPVDTATYAEIRARHAAEWSDLGVEWLFAWGSTEHTAALHDDRWNGPPGASEPLRGLVGDFFFDRTAPRQVFVNGAID